jgi:hypothetical protein
MKRLFGWPHTLLGKVKQQRRALALFLKSGGPHETARVHHASWRGGTVAAGGVAQRGERDASHC